MESDESQSMIVGETSTHGITSYDRGIVDAWNGIGCAGAAYGMFLVLVGAMILFLYDYQQLPTIGEFFLGWLVIAIGSLIGAIVGYAIAVVVAIASWGIAGALVACFPNLISPRAALAGTGGLTGFLATAIFWLTPRHDGFSAEGILLWFLVTSAIVMGHFGCVIYGYRSRQAQVFFQPIWLPNRSFTVRNLLALTVWCAVLILIGRLIFSVSRTIEAIPLYLLVQVVCLWLDERLRRWWLRRSVNQLAGFNHALAKEVLTQNDQSE